MEVIPELLILNGRVVTLSRGNPDTAQDIGDPIELAHRFADAGALHIHVVDIDGALSGSPKQLDLARSLAAIVPVQWGGGIRIAEHALAALDTGVRRVVLGTAAVDNPALLKSIPSDKLVVSLDIDEGRLSLYGRDDTDQSIRPSRFATTLAAQGVDRILCTPIQSDGALLGPDLETLVSISMCGASILAHGGVGELHDLVAISRLPAIEGIVVGAALHTGAFTYAQALVAICDVD
jgi:phosphoribosylformimino-5-aminoimidazole carboxamide ribotide isomerase